MKNLGEKVSFRYVEKVRFRTTFGEGDAHTGRVESETPTAYDKVRERGSPAKAANRSEREFKFRER